jgi:hypothetical protein
LRKLFFCFILIASHRGEAQIRSSFATDVSLLRNFSPRQKFWAVGQNVTADFHFNRKETGFVSFCYYSPGTFVNLFTAQAKSPATNPQKLDYKVSGRYRFREVSLGWKHYFKGSFDEEIKWNLYGLGAFGLMVSRSDNDVISVDSALYRIGPPLEGVSSFFRLTIDLGLGVELPLGGNFFMYSELKTWIPTTDYPATSIHENKRLPMPLILNGGLRILFGY